ncbi:hypothetical protein ACFWP0_17500 [Achromobacter sp. NPDC058515]|uniref:hypothetical protein n=1 Tax=Achromobacter sp. NPDC058515 TaxID=3346533 RepID=UPI0036559410
MADKAGGYLGDILSSGLAVYAEINQSAAGSIPHVVSHLIREERMSALRAWRIYLGISVRDLSSATGISVPSIELLDQGELPLCQWTALRVAGAMKVVSVHSMVASERLVAWCRAARMAADGGKGAAPGRKPLRFADMPLHLYR